MWTKKSYVVIDGMSKNDKNIFLIGNICSDIDKQTTASGISYCRFSIAVNRRQKNQNGEYETDFFNFFCWRNLADNCANNLSKGKKVSIVGSIQIRKYTAQDGTPRQAIDIQADDVEFLSPRTEQGAQQNPTNAAPVLESEPASEEGLPF